MLVKSLIAVTLLVSSVSAGRRPPAPFSCDKIEDDCEDDDYYGRNCSEHDNVEARCKGLFDWYEDCPKHYPKENCTVGAQLSYKNLVVPLYTRFKSRLINSTCSNAMSWCTADAGGFSSDCHERNKICIDCVNTYSTCDSPSPGNETCRKDFDNCFENVMSRNGTLKNTGPIRRLSPTLQVRESVEPATSGTAILTPADDVYNPMDCKLLTDSCVLSPSATNCPTIEAECQACNAQDSSCRQKTDATQCTIDTQFCLKDLLSSHLSTYNWPAVRSFCDATDEYCEDTTSSSSSVCQQQNAACLKCQRWFSSEETLYRMSPSTLHVAVDTCLSNAITLNGSFHRGRQSLMIPPTLQTRSVPIPRDSSLACEALAHEYMAALWPWTHHPEEFEMRSGCDQCTVLQNSCDAELYHASGSPADWSKITPMHTRCVVTGQGCLHDFYAKHFNSPIPSKQSYDLDKICGLAKTFCLDDGSPSTVCHDQFVRCNACQAADKSQYGTCFKTAMSLDGKFPPVHMNVSMAREINNVVIPQSIDSGVFDCAEARTDCEEAARDVPNMPVDCGRTYDACEICQSKVRSSTFALRRCMRDLLRTKPPQSVSVGDDDGINNFASTKDENVALASSISSGEITDCDMARGNCEKYARNNPDRSVDCNKSYNACRACFIQGRTNTHPRFHECMEQYTHNGPYNDISARDIDVSTSDGCESAKKHCVHEVRMNPHFRANCKKEFKACKARQQPPANKAITARALDSTLSAETSTTIQGYNCGHARNRCVHMMSMNPQLGLDCDKEYEACNADGPRIRLATRQLAGLNNDEDRDDDDDDDDVVVKFFDLELRKSAFCPVAADLFCEVGGKFSTNFNISDCDKFFNACPACLEMFSDADDVFSCLTAGISSNTSIFDGLYNVLAKRSPGAVSMETPRTSNGSLTTVTCNCTNCSGSFRFISKRQHYQPLRIEEDEVKGIDEQSPEEPEYLPAIVNSVDLFNVSKDQGITVNCKVALYACLHNPLMDSEKCSAMADKCYRCAYFEHNGENASEYEGHVVDMLKMVKVQTCYHDTFSSGTTLVSNDILGYSCDQAKKTCEQKFFDENLPTQPCQNQYQACLSCQPNEKACLEGATDDDPHFCSIMATTCFGSAMTLDGTWEDQWSEVEVADDEASNDDTDVLSHRESTKLSSVSRELLTAAKSTTTLKSQSIPVRSGSTHEALSTPSKLVTSKTAVHVVSADLLAKTSAIAKS